MQKCPAAESRQRYGRHKILIANIIYEKKYERRYIYTD